MTQEDFTFACKAVSGATTHWGALRVVRFEGHEQISGLYRYEVFLLAGPDTEAPDPNDLIGASATLRIATKSDPAHRVVHGIVAEAEDVNDLPEGALYRVVIVPPWARAQHQVRCRIFLERTLRHIIDTVLQGDPSMTRSKSGSVNPDDGSLTYWAVEEEYTWRIADPSRLDDHRVRAYCVQYNESDFAFVSRLLEEEGISYHFENGAGQCLLVLSDTDAGRSKLTDLAVGPTIKGREVDTFRLGGRLRTSSVVFDDYNWKKPSLDLATHADVDAGADGLDAYHYPGGYPDSPGQGRLLAQVVADLHKTEAEFGRAEGPLRVLFAGAIFDLEHMKERFAGQYLVTHIRVRGEQSGVASIASSEKFLDGLPFRAEADCARRGRGSRVEDSRFRPAHTTPRPRVFGAQTAFVTAEPGQGSEVNVSGPDALNVGCVRLKFHWDSEHTRHAKQSTSKWVRVNEPFAGPGQGGVWHPQVGTEVVVEYEEGNPDRPVVTGRVYNGMNLPKHGGAAPISTMISRSTPGHGVKNELTFDDTAGSELFYMNAGKDMTVDVGNNRQEHVASMATMRVGSNNLETIGSNNSDDVGANDSLTCGANQTKAVGANRTRTIGANRSKFVGASETRTVGANFSNTVAASLTETAGGAVTETYGATKAMTVGASLTLTAGGSKTTSVAGSVTQNYGADQTIEVGGARTITVNGMEIQHTGGNVTHEYGPWTKNITGPMISLVGGGVTHTVDGAFTINAPLNLHFSLLETESHGTVAHATGVDISAKGLSLEATGLKLSATGLSASATGLSVEMKGFEKEDAAAEAREFGAKLHIGFHIFI